HQLEVRVLDDAVQRAHAHVPGAPLDDAVAHPPEPSAAASPDLTDRQIDPKQPCGFFSGGQKRRPVHSERPWSGQPSTQEVMSMPKTAPPSRRLQPIPVALAG